MKKEFKQKTSRQNKRAVSEMLAYVLLIAISISLAIGVYAWLVFIAGGIEELEKCPDGVSLIIQSYECLGNKKIQIEAKNKGLFNVSGYYIKGTNNKSQIAWFKLKNESADCGIKEGMCEFLSPLPPANSVFHNFSYNGLGNLIKIEIEPFKKSQKGDYIPCENAAINEEVNCP